MSHAINPPSCGKKGGGHKNMRISKILKSPRVSWHCGRVSGSASNSFRPCEMKDLFSTAQLSHVISCLCSLVSVFVCVCVCVSFAVDGYAVLLT